MAGHLFELQPSPCPPSKEKRTLKKSPLGSPTRYGLGDVADLGGV